MLSAFLWILLAYFLYRFVFNFLIPIFRVSRQMKRQVRDFQQNMYQAQQQQQAQQPGASAQPKNTSMPSEKAGDYIDFEEIKQE